MSGRHTNLGLLVMVGLAFLTGIGAFLVGSAAWGALVTAHALLGLGVLVLSRPKAAIAARGMSRSRSGRVLSVMLAVSALVTVASGVAQVSGLWGRAGPYTMMQVHVGAGTATIFLVIVHAFQRPTRLRRTDFDRRNALRAAGVLGAAGLAYLVTEAAWAVSSAPAARRRFTGSHQVAHWADAPVTQWLNDPVLHLPDTQTVTVDGEEYIAERISDFGDSVEATLDCTGGWYTTQVFSGAWLGRLLGPVAGESIVVRSATGYWRRFPIEHGERLMLATHVNGDQLSEGHGGPIRLVVPDRRGYWWVKWVDTVEMDDLPAWWQPPLPTA